MNLDQQAENRPPVLGRAELAAVACAAAGHKWVDHHRVPVLQPAQHLSAGSGNRSHHKRQARVGAQRYGRRERAGQPVKRGVRRIACCAPLRGQVIDSDEKPGTASIRCQPMMAAEPDGLVLHRRGRETPARKQDAADGTLGKIIRLGKHGATISGQQIR